LYSPSALSLCRRHLSALELRLGLRSTAAEKHLRWRRHPAELQALPFFASKLWFSQPAEAVLEQHNESSRLDIRIVCPFWHLLLGQGCPSSLYELLPHQGTLLAEVPTTTILPTGSSPTPRRLHSPPQGSLSRSHPWGLSDCLYQFSTISITWATVEAVGDLVVATATRVAISVLLGVVANSALT